jgi:hypothetical protein
MCTSIRYGDEKEFNLVFEEAMNNETIASVKNDLLLGLSCAKEQWLLNKYLDSQLEGNILVALDNVATKSNGHLLAWYFLKSNWEKIYSG